MQSEEIEEGISLQELFQCILDRLHIVIIVLMLFVAGAVLYLHYAVKEYQTTVTMIVEPISKMTSIGKVLSSGFFNSDADISTEIHLLTNITNLEMAIQNLDLSQYRNNKGLPYTDPSALGSLSGKVTTSNFKDTNIVELSVTDENPQFAAAYANALAKNFNDMLSTYGKDSKVSQIEFLQEQIPSTEQQLDDAQDKLFDYKADTGIDFLSNSTQSLVNHISYLSMRRKPLQLQVVKNNSLLQEFQGVSQGTLPSLDDFRNDAIIGENLKIYAMAFDELIQFDVVSNNDYRNTTSLSVVNGAINESVNDRITILNAQMAESKKNLMKRMRVLVESRGIHIEDRIDSNYYDINNYCNTVIERICNEVDISSIGKTISTFEQEFNKLPLLEKELSKLQSDVDSLEAIRNELNSYLQEITLTAAAQNNNVKLVSPARIPHSPVSPNPLLILAVSILLGGAIGVLLCLFLQMKDDKLHFLEDIKKIGGDAIPLLGWIPLIEGKQKTDFHRPLRLQSEDRDSYISEQYKTITSNILYGKNSNKKVFTITSSNINEGKSNLTCNISLYLAHLGYKVLIVDADLKNHSVGKFFNLAPDTIGYVEILQKGESFQKACHLPIQEMGNLHVLIPGKTPVGPSVFYSHTRYKMLFDSLKNSYDYVFIDIPPLEHASGLKGLLEQVDAILLCARLSICTKTNLKNLICELDGQKDKLGGIIATACALEQIDSYKNKYSRYHYQYGRNVKAGSTPDDFEYVKSERKAVKIFKKDLKRRLYSER
jgi:capsular exopolysaccharide synthesis family protein